MTLYLLDTDHISLAQRGHPQVIARIMATNANNLFISIVTVQEQMRGRLAQTQQAKSSDSLIRAYKLLHETIAFSRTIPILDFDEQSSALFDGLRQQKIRIGTLDLRIAAIALAHNQIVVTRNTRDFARVPNLRMEDWTAVN